MSVRSVTLVHMMNLEGRSPVTVELARFFGYDHLPAHLQATSKACHDVAEAMIRDLPDCDMLHAGLRRLLEAKDCFVRAAL